MVLDDGTATAIGIAIGLLIISGLVALWLRSCRNHQHRASQAAAGGSNNSGQPGFRSMYIKSLIQFTNNSICKISLENTLSSLHYFQCKYLCEKQI